LYTFVDVRSSDIGRAAECTRELAEPAAHELREIVGHGCVKRWMDYTRDMKIGAAARASGLTIKAIRHYESVCLLRKVPRSGAYRDFSDRDVNTLRLAAHCRGLGFSVSETKDVLALVTASEPHCPRPDQMNAILENKLRTVRGEIRELKRKARELEKVRTYVQKRLAGA